jgi:hypothetical protein
MQVELQGSGLLSLLDEYKPDYKGFEEQVAANWAHKYDLLWALWQQHQAWKVRNGTNALTDTHTHTPPHTLRNPSQAVIAVQRGFL